MLLKGSLNKPDWLSEEVRLAKREQNPRECWAREQRAQRAANPPSEDVVSSHA